eukprot:1657608-Prymnesium_polylepis.1
MGAKGGARPRPRQQAARLALPEGPRCVLHAMRRVPRAAARHKTLRTSPPALRCAARPAFCKEAHSRAHSPCVSRARRTLRPTQPPRRPLGSRPRGRSRRPTAAARPPLGRRTS